MTTEIQKQIKIESKKELNFTLQGTTFVGGGTNNYEALANKPKINGVELIGNTILNYATQDDIDATVGNIAVLLELI